MLTREREERREFQDATDGRGGGIGPVDEAACGATDAIWESPGREERHAVGEPLQIEPSPIQSEAYLLAYCRYVELSSVRTPMVSRLDEYRRSSYAQRIGRGDEFTRLDTDPCFVGLGDTPQVRASR